VLERCCRKSAEQKASIKYYGAGCEGAFSMGAPVYVWKLQITISKLQINSNLQYRNFKPESITVIIWIL
jgi:hypothetical protein